jgi:NAD(P)H-dependent FMN reductase
VNVVAISGSLQRQSSNSALLRAVALVATTVDVTLWDELGDLPHFRPDGEGDEHVDSLRNAVATADAVLLATPEYAGGMPGTLKNALDWLVGSGELAGKAVVIVSAAPSDERGQNARRWVAEVVKMQGGVVHDSFSVATSASDGTADIDDKAKEVLRRALAALDAADKDDFRCGGGAPRR